MAIFKLGLPTVDLVQNSSFLLICENLLMKLPNRTRLYFVAIKTRYKNTY